MFGCIVLWHTNSFVFESESIIEDEATKDNCGDTHPVNGCEGPECCDDALPVDCSENESSCGDASSVNCGEDADSSVNLFPSVDISDVVDDLDSCIS